MKVLSVLLCFALVHGITANVFKHRNHQPQDLEYQQQVDITNQRHSQRGNHHSGQQEQSQHTQNQHWEQQEPEQQYGAYPYRQYQSSSAQQSQEQDKPYSTWHQLHQKPHSHHYSSESNQDSVEGQKTRNSYNYVRSTRYGHQQRGSVLPTSDQQDESTAPFWPKMAVGPNIAVQDKEDIEKILTDAQNAMEHITPEQKVKLQQIFEHAPQQDDDATLNVTQLARKHQYSVEEHRLKTDDGYELTVFRILPKKHTRDVQKRPVVFLMHGILGSADDWLLMGPQKSLAYLLSDAGYDVWLGNARGNKYSQRHSSKNPAVTDFWEFDMDDMALHDLPAMLDHVLQTTMQEKLYYIGHSLGTSIFFALTAARPEYNDKITMMYAMSPMVYMTNVRSPLIRMVAPTTKIGKIIQQQLGSGPFNPSKELIHTFGGSLLEKEINKQVSTNLNFVLAGFRYSEPDISTIRVVMHHLPAGTSNKLMIQIGQIVAQGFQKFNYGPKVNQKVYGSEEPPKYDVHNVQAPVTLYYSEEDWLANPKDVARLEQELPNVKESYKVSDHHFSSLDFQFSSRAPEIVYRRLLESMQQNQ